MTLGLLHFLEQLCLRCHAHQAHRVSLHGQAAGHLHLGGVCLQLQERADSFVVGRLANRLSSSCSCFRFARNAVLLFVHAEQVCEFGVIYLPFFVFLWDDLNYVLWAL